MHTFLSNTWLIFYPVLSIKINRQIKIIRTVQCDYNAKKKKKFFTSAVLVADVRKPPDVPQIHSKADHRQQEVHFFAPLVARLCLQDHRNRNRTGVRAHRQVVMVHVAVGKKRKEKKKLRESPWVKGKLFRGDNRWGSGAARAEGNRHAASWSARGKKTRVEWSAKRTPPPPPFFSHSHFLTHLTPIYTHVRASGKATTGWD